MEEKIPTRFFLTPSWGSDLFYYRYPLVYEPELISFGLIKNPIICYIGKNGDKNYIGAKFKYETNDKIFVKYKDQKLKNEDKLDNCVILKFQTSFEFPDIESRNLENTTEMIILYNTYIDGERKFYFVNWYKIPKNGYGVQYEEIGIETIDLKKSSEHRQVAKLAKEEQQKYNSIKLNEEYKKLYEDTSALKTVKIIVERLFKEEKDVTVEFTVDFESKKTMIDLIKFYKLKYEIIEPKLVKFKY